MGRPPLPIGTNGSITVTGTKPKFVARTRFRDSDGVTRNVERGGKTEGAAKAALNTALRDRKAHASGGDLNAESTIAQLLAVWWPRKIATAAKFAEGSIASYEDIQVRVINPGIGKLRLREATTGRIDQWLITERETRPSAADLAQTILRQAFALAAQRDAVSANPVLGTSKRVKPKPVPRALTDDDLARMRAATASMRINTWLADAFETQLGLGLRIGEALALRVENLDLDNPGGARARIVGTVIAPKGRGTRLQKHTKDGPDGRRTVMVPDWVADILRHRAPLSRSGLIFETRNATLVNPRNFRESWRNIRDAAGLGWVKPHHMRKTALTTVARELGDEVAQRMADHKDIATTRAHYIEATEDLGPDARVALNQLAPDSLRESKKSA
ncbi:tyrosine-type recombinase/integrase [Conyzicola sp.]|uniref:tyrosine-type recombinase/integrase n=1 Tax=Conyzicola sp. TaxID=1969404 RepID=UPI0039899014